MTNDPDVIGPLIIAMIGGFIAFGVLLSFDGTGNRAFLLGGVVFGLIFYKMYTDNQRSQVKQNNAP